MPKSHAPSPREFRAKRSACCEPTGSRWPRLAVSETLRLRTLRFRLNQADIDDRLRHDGRTTEEVRCLRRVVKIVHEVRG